MSSNRKPTPTLAPMHDLSEKKLAIGKPDSWSPPVSQPARKRNWTDQQWKQSQQYWQKQHRNTVQALRTGREKAENTFIDSLPQARKAELARLSDMKLVARPANTRMPPAWMPPLPAPHATKRYKDVMSDIGDFLHPKAAVRSKFNEGGPQFIQGFTDNGVSVIRRVGVDVEPSKHVFDLRPHLNLQTQHESAVIKDGPLKDPHHPVLNFSPFAKGRWKYSQHALAGMALNSDERRAFAERYIHSLGIPIKRE